MGVAVFAQDLIADANDIEAGGVAFAIVRHLALGPGQMFNKPVRLISSQHAFGLAEGFRLGDGGGEIEMRQILQDVESRLITAALEDSDGNVSAAAKRLNMQRTTLIQRISKLGLRD